MLWYLPWRRGRLSFWAPSSNQETGSSNVTTWRGHRYALSGAAVAQIPLEFWGIATDQPVRSAVLDKVVGVHRGSAVDSRELSAVGVDWHPSCNASIQHVWGMSSAQHTFSVALSWSTPLRRGCWSLWTWSEAHQNEV